MALRLLVFDRAHVCVHDRLFVPMEAGERTESMQLVMGMCHSLRALLGRMAAAADGDRADAAGPFHGAAFALGTSRYRLAYHETTTGWRVVLMARADAVAGSGPLQAAAAALFADALVPMVVRSPLAAYGSGVSGVGAANGAQCFDAVPGLRERTDAVLRRHGLLVERV